MVVVGQRIHAGDVSGYILSGETGEEWVHLNLAAEYEHENKCETFIDGELFWEDWRTEPGELLWPERFPAHIIEIAKRKHGAMGFAALFQQRPMPVGGGQFKAQWFRYFATQGEYYALGRGDGIKHVRVDACQIFATSDLAISTKQTADYTCLCVWAITPDRELLLLQCIHDRLDNPAQQKAITAVYHRYQPDFIQIESVAYQLSLVQQLRQQGLPIKEYRPVKDKVARASSASVYYEGEQVFHPKNAPWLQEWEEELLLFPRARNDDRVDNASMACEHLAKPRAIGGMMLASDEEIGYDPYADDEDYPGPNDPHSVFWR
jgi:predicted phage terminase large subunit-like protein